MKIFIVEDDTNIRQMESYALQNSGYETGEFGDAQELYHALKKSVPHMFILDIMLPGEDGLSILKKLRKDPATAQIPVMMVTAKSTELDTVKGLDLGADDYISKPFGIMEFISRVKALIRRSSPACELAVYQAGEITLDDEKHLVTVADQACELTYKEYELLKYLIINRGIVLSREKIMDRVWGTDYQGESRTVDMHIKTLRQKLGAGGTAIKTVRNVGYKLEP